MLGSIKYAKIISRGVGDIKLTGLSSKRSNKVGQLNFEFLPKIKINAGARVNNLDDQFFLPSFMCDPPLPTPEFDKCFREEILLNSRGTSPIVMFTGPSSVGKSTALLTTLAGVSYSHLADEKRLICGISTSDRNKGFPGVVYLAFRGLCVSKTLVAFARAAGIEKFTDEIDLGIQFRMMVSDFNKRYSGRPVYVVIEDIIFHLC